MWRIRGYRRSSKLATDERGTSMIELALVAPVMGFLILGLVDLAMGFSAQLNLEQAAARALEKGTSAGLAGSSYDYVRAEASRASGEPIDHVTLDNWLECDGVRKASFSDSCAGGQQIARYVGVEIAGEFTPLFDYSNFVRMFGGQQGMGATVPIEGDAIVRVQ